jgi:hypothetical protein
MPGQIVWEMKEKGKFLGKASEQSEPAGREPPVLFLEM